MDNKALARGDLGGGRGDGGQTDAFCHKSFVAPNEREVVFGAGWVSVCVLFATT